MRKELSDFVKIKVLIKNDTTLEFTIRASNSVIFDESAKKSTAGILYQQALTLIITREESKRIPALPISYKAIVELSDCDDIYTWGTEDIPVDITVTPRLETVQLAMSCNSLHPLL